MSLGFKHAGIAPQLAVELEQIHVDTYNENFAGDHAICADARKVSGQSLLENADIKKGELDVLFGGPPCQGFSLVGKRDPKDPRNDLTLQFARLVEELKPRYFVIENVQGLLSGPGEDIVKAVKTRLKRAKYTVKDPIRVLNAADYGVPQDRRRVFIVGHLPEETAPEYPTGSTKEQKNRVTTRMAISDLPDVDKHDSLLETNQFDGKLGPASDYVKSLAAFTAPKKAKFRPHTGFQRTVHSKETVTRFSKVEEGAYDSISRFRRLAWGRVSHTLRAGTGADRGSFMAARPIHPDQPRVVTVREGARLQSFPDWFKFHETKWHAFRQIGNSVPPLLAATVARHVSDAAKNH